jgi:hypothetical protein
MLAAVSAADSRRITMLDLLECWLQLKQRLKSTADDLVGPRSKQRRESRTDMSKPARLDVHGEAAPAAEPFCQGAVNPSSR